MSRNCTECAHPISPLCVKCHKWLGDPTAILRMAGDLEAAHGSVEGATIHELFLTGDVPPQKKKGKVESSKRKVG